MESLTDEQLELISTVACRMGVESYRKEMEHAKLREVSDKKKKTKQLLSSYRRIKNQIDTGYNFTEAEKAEYRWKFVEDLMGDAERPSKSERIIADEERKRQESLYTLHWLENALVLYKNECDLAINEEERRRYRIIKRMYLENSPMTIDEIADMENISRRTAFRDIDTAVNILAIYLFGIKN